jgi:DNA-binding CsgD family transcriptional regulator
LEEIAEETGMSFGSVHMHLSRGLKKLRANGLLKTCAELAEELGRNRRGNVEWER